MIKDGVIKTTPLTSILGGITRKTVMEYFKQKNMPVIEQRFTRDELWCADEAFLTGTAAEITPIQLIDTRIIGNGKPGPVALQLKKDYAAIVRGELSFPWTEKWLARFSAS
jgi:branched-chain amino acid aminotransferase